MPPFIFSPHCLPGPFQVGLVEGVQLVDDQGQVFGGGRPEGVGTRLLVVGVQRRQEEGRQVVQEDL